MDVDATIKKIKDLLGDVFINVQYKIFVFRLKLVQAFFE